MGAMPGCFTVAYSRGDSPSRRGPASPWPPGSAPATSPRPPVLENGATSDEMKRICIVRWGTLRAGADRARDLCWCRSGGQSGKSRQPRAPRARVHGDGRAVPVVGGSLRPPTHGRIRRHRGASLQRRVAPPRLPGRDGGGAGGGGRLRGRAHRGGRRQRPRARSRLRGGGRAGGADLRGGRRRAPGGAGAGRAAPGEGVGHPTGVVPGRRGRHLARLPGRGRRGRRGGARPLAAYPSQRGTGRADRQPRRGGGAAAPAFPAAAPGRLDLRRRGGGALPPRHPGTRSAG